MRLLKALQPAARRGTLPVLFACCFSPVAAADVTTHDPNRTATIFVHGFDVGGSSDSGVFGDDEFNPLLDELAAFAGLPTINQPGGAFRPNVVTATNYYGDTPPSYYTPHDMTDLEAVTAQWGGGMPRYAVIVAKYARFVMERSGAQQVNFVSASMGSLVTRWLIEKNVEGLAAEGKIARWLTLEGVVSGNWAASNDELWELFQTPPIDVEQMHYAWIQENLHAPRTEADNPLYSSILIGQTASTDDSANEGALTAAMLLYGEFQPNDGVQGVNDSHFLTVTPQSRLLGRPPTLSYFHVNHYQLADHLGARAAAATFLTQKRRVRITMTRAQVTDMHEPALPFWDWTPAEVVFQSRLYSPQVQARWAITEPLSARHRQGASTPIRYFYDDNEEQFFTHVIFDDFVLDSETVVELELWAEEIDWDVRYGVTEPLPRPYDALGSACPTIPIAPGTYPVSAASWNADLVVEVLEYPFASLRRPDLNGDGVVNVLDLIDLLLCFGQPAVPPCDTGQDVNGDGDVNGLDLLELLLAFGTAYP